MRTLKCNYLHILMNQLLTDNWSINFCEIEEGVVEFWKDSPYLELRVSYPTDQIPKGLLSVMVYENQKDYKHYPLILPYPTSSQDIRFLLSTLQYMRTHVGIDRANEGYSILDYHKEWRKIGK